ncbi:MAG: threonine--tRNA ligase [Candidatus Woesearchaeota archaeon]
MVKITFPNGDASEFASGVSGKEIAEKLSKSLAKEAVAMQLDSEVVDMSTKITKDAKVRFLTPKDKEGVEVIRHSCSHLMAHAIKRLFPGAVPTLGPVIDDGFYYDFDNLTVKQEDLEKIEKVMHQISNEDFPIKRTVFSAEDAKKTFKNTFKQEIINDLDAKEISAYEQGDFVDMCTGPHVPSTSFVKHFKLLKIAGSYWRGNSDNKMLTRIYGTAWGSDKELKEYLHNLEEAEKRDHKKIGKQLDLFKLDERVGPGLVLWTPKGTIIRTELQNFISEHLNAQGYQAVITPHIGKLDLYRTSGHYPYYQDSQYPPLVDREQLAKMAKEGTSCAALASAMEEGKVSGYLLKPMNCPHHISLYLREAHSYRELPIRYSEFGTVYRYEQSGEIGGMTRVRGFTQDDAHIFCTEEQVQQEVLGCLELVKIIFNKLGMKDYRVRVGLRDPDGTKYVGKKESWEKSEAAVKIAAKGMGVPFTEEQGEAAFYGPKIDFVVKDVLGREWQLGTIQVDYNLPERFELEYAGADGSSHRPVMIHRAPFGSMERFVGVLIEHFAGAFPFWLNPVQVTLMTVTDEQQKYADSVYLKFKEAGIRVHMDDRMESIGKKVREAQLQKIPFMITIGAKEAEANTIAIRTLDGKVKFGVKTDEFIKQCVEWKKNRTLQTEL